MHLCIDPLRPIGGACTFPVPGGTTSSAGRASVDGSSPVLR